MIDLYECPADKLGTHFLTFNITQKQIILGLMKRSLHFDFYRKRLSIRGGFEVRGQHIKSWDQDANEHTFVHIIFNTSSNSVQEFWLE
jgi:hypothetical protein